MEQIMILATVLVPIITGVLQVVKNAVNLPKNVVPLVALAVGLVIGVIASPFTDLELTLRLWAGGLAGLSAVGLFELVNPRDGGTKEPNM